MGTIISAPLTPVAATSASTPHPSVTEGRSRKEAAVSVMKGLQKANRMITDDDMSTVWVRVNSFDREALERFQRAFSCGKDATEVLLHLLVFDPSNEIINATAHFIPDLPAEAWRSSASLVRGLTCYEEFPRPFDFINAEAPVQLQCIALLKTTSALVKYSDLSDDTADDTIGIGAHQGLTWKAINDHAWRLLVMERPADADLLAAIIKQHGNVGANAARGLLEGGTPQLAKGML